MLLRAVNDLFLTFSSITVVYCCAEVHPIESYWECKNTVVVSISLAWFNGITRVLALLLFMDTFHGCYKNSEHSYRQWSIPSTFPACGKLL